MPDSNSDTDNEILFTKWEREELCIDDDCEEHGNGKVPCRIPKTKREGEAQLRADDRMSGGGVQTRKARTSVVWSDDVERSD